MVHGSVGSDRQVQSSHTDSGSRGSGNFSPAIRRSHASCQFNSLAHTHRCNTVRLELQRMKWMQERVYLYDQVPFREGRAALLDSCRIESPGSPDVVPIPSQLAFPSSDRWHPCARCHGCCGPFIYTRSRTSCVPMPVCVDGVHIGLVVAAVFLLQSLVCARILHASLRDMEIRMRCVEICVQSLAKD